MSPFLYADSVSIDLIFPYLFFCFFFLQAPATTEIYTFPYTTLFRSGAWPPRSSAWPATMTWYSWIPRRMPRPRRVSPCARSEEHTSELQSLRHLVCRLLLEKKKKNKNETEITHT